MVYSFFGGIILGLIFFGGLYYTTQKLPKAKKPALLMFSSITIRMIILVGGLYLIFSNEISRLLIAILGVFISKYIVVKYVKKGSDL